MGIRQRQDRERDAVRRTILNAARELFVAEGYRNVSMRKIAERIEYSPAAIYGYFENKDDIFFALAEEGFRLLFTADPTADPPSKGADSSPMDALRRSLWHFYEFSKRHPEYFELMFVDRSVPRISRDWERFAFVRESKRTFAAAIQQCADGRFFPAGTDPHAVFRILTTVMYGAAVLRLASRLPSDENADALAHDMLEATLAGLRAGSPVTFTASDDPAGDDSDRPTSDSTDPLLSKRELR